MKDKPKTEVPVFPRREVPVSKGETEEQTCRNHANVTTSSELAAHRVINAAERTSGMGQHIDTPTMLETLREQANAFNKGDLKQAEAMLVNQATALQTLFARLTEKALGAEYMSNFEGYMRLALRAQSQCRTTLETLATIKNPPIVYAKQANIAHGHQQVNNGSQAREIEIEPNQLLETDNGKRMDTGAQATTVTSNPALEAMGKIDRT